MLARKNYIDVDSIKKPIPNNYMQPLNKPKTPSYDRMLQLILQRLRNLETKESHDQALLQRIRQLEADILEREQMQDRETKEIRSLGMQMKEFRSLVKEQEEKSPHLIHVLSKQWREKVRAELESFCVGKVDQSEVQMQEIINSQIANMKQWLDALNKKIHDANRDGIKFGQENMAQLSRMRDSLSEVSLFVKSETKQIMRKTDKKLNSVTKLVNDLKDLFESKYSYIGLEMKAAVKELTEMSDERFDWTQSNVKKLKMHFDRHVEDANQKFDSQEKEVSKALKSFRAFVNEQIHGVYQEISSLKKKQKRIAGQVEADCEMFTEHHMEHMKREKVLANRVKDLESIAVSEHAWGNILQKVEFEIEKREFGKRELTISKTQQSEKLKMLEYLKAKFADSEDKLRKFNDNLKLELSEISDNLGEFTEKFAKRMELYGKDLEKNMDEIHQEIDEKMKDLQDNIDEHTAVLETTIEGAKKELESELTKAKEEIENEMEQRDSNQSTKLTDCMKDISALQNELVEDVQSYQKATSKNLRNLKTFTDDSVAEINDVLTKLSKNQEEGSLTMEDQMITTEVRSIVSYLVNSVVDEVHEKRVDEFSDKTEQSFINHKKRIKKCNAFIKENREYIDNLHISFEEAEVKHVLDRIIDQVSEKNHNHQLNNYMKSTVKLLNTIQHQHDLDMQELNTLEQDQQAIEVRNALDDIIDRVCDLKHNENLDKFMSKTTKLLDEFNETKQTENVEIQIQSVVQDLLQRIENDHERSNLKENILDEVDMRIEQAMQPIKHYHEVADAVSFILSKLDVSIELSEMISAKNELLMQMKNM